MAAGFVANWGNDLNNGLTWATAKKSLQGARDALLAPVNVKGYFNAGANYGVCCGQDGKIIGFPAVFDGLGILPCFITSSDEIWFNKCIFQNFTTLQLGKVGIWETLVFKNIESITTVTVNNRRQSKIVFFKITSLSLISVGEKATFYLCGIITLKNTTELKLEHYAGHIYSTSSLNIQHKNIATYLKYCLFHNMSFKFTGGGLGSDETAFSYPTGTTDDEKFNNLRQRCVLVYGGLQSDYFINCRYLSASTNELFVDADNGVLNLVPGSIASNMYYDGTFIGALNEGRDAMFPSEYIPGSISNIDNNGQLVDQTINAEATSQIIDLGSLRKITSFAGIEALAYNNGNQLNAIDNLGPEISAGSTLTIGKVYWVDFGNIVSNAISYAFRQTFTASSTSFSTSDGGKVREVLTDKYNGSISIKCSRTDATLASASTITMDLHLTPTVNSDVNSEPTYGNRDVLYNSVNGVPLICRYIQFILKIKGKNLPAK